MDVQKIYEHTGKVMDITNTDVVIVYGNVHGNIFNSDNVIVINGNIEGDICNVDNVLGVVSEHGIGDKALWEKCRADVPISRRDLGIDPDQAVLKLKNKKKKKHCNSKYNDPRPENRGRYGR